MDEKTLQIIIEAQDRATAELKSISGQLQTIQKDVSRVSEQVDKSASKMKSGFSAVASALQPAVEASRNFAIGLGAIGVGVGFLGKQLLQAAGQAEQTRISFEVMTGSVATADKHMRELASFASKTPFTLTGMEEASKRLMAYGFATEQVIPAMKVLGDISAGVGTEKLPQLILALGQVRTQGILLGGEMRQFTEAGVPLIDALARHFGVASNQIRDMVSSGKVGFSDVMTALTDLTTEGGKFEDMMGRQAETFNQMVSNLGDAWEQFLRGEGAKLLEWGKAVVGMLITFVQRDLPKLVSAIDKVVKWFEKYKIAIAIVAGALIGALVPAIWAAASAFGALLVTLAPFMLGGAVVGALIGGLILLSKKFGGFGNMMKALGLHVYAAGQTVVGYFKLMIEGILKWLNSGAEKLEGWVNKVIKLGNKIGLELEEVDFSIKTDLGSDENFKNVATALDKVDKMITDAKEKTEEITAEGLNVDLSPLFAGMDAQSGSLSEEVKKGLEKAEGSIKDFESFLGETLTKLKVEHDEEITKITEKLTDLDEQYKQTSEAGQEALEDLQKRSKESLDGIKADIDAVRLRMKELNEDFESQKQVDTGSLASAFASAYEKVADLKNQLSRATTAQQIVDIRNQLQEEESALARTADVQEKYASEITEAKRRAGLSDLERAIEDFNTKRTLAQQEFDQQMLILQQELTALKLKRSEEKALSEEAIAQQKKETEEKLNAILQEKVKVLEQQKEEMELYLAKTDFINRLIVEAGNTRIATEQHVSSITEELINKEIKLYKDLEQQIRRAAQARSEGLINPSPINVRGNRATGGPIPSTGLYRLHQGEYVLNRRDSEKQTGGGVTVNILGGTYLSEDVALDIGNKIVDRLKLNSRM